MILLVIALSIVNNKIININKLKINIKIKDKINNKNTLAKII